MKKISSFIVKARYVLLGIFVALVGLCSFLMTKVNINYDMLIYLDKDSTSTVALNKMEEEFGSVGQAQIMIKDISFDEAKNVESKLGSIKGIASVVFTENVKDTEYFILNAGSEDTGSALYKVFLTTGNYDVESYDTVDEIRNILISYRDSGHAIGTVALNGGAVESKFLTETLDSDMTKILIIVALVVLVILTIVSQSWIEPLIFALVAGGAILINMGTNILLNALPNIGNSMSFITKAIAAVMQLALAMDYSIILLHAYKEQKAKGLNKNEAMTNALSSSFAPVSSSSLTTIAGLVALMFMSFSIGFDVGLVLAKGILVSLLCVFLFMPALLILFDPLLEKTKHKSIDEIANNWNEKRKAKNKKCGKKSHSFAGFQYKTRYIIPSIALALVIVGAIFNFNSEHDFVLKASTDDNAAVNVENKLISDTFGTQNTLVVLLPKDTYSYEKEQDVIKYLNEYQYDGENVINSRKGLTTYGINIPLTSAEVSQKFGLPQNVVDVVYANMNVSRATVEELITYLSTKNEAGITPLEAYLGNIQKTIDDSYNSFKTSLYNEDLSINQTAIAQMIQFCTAYENGFLEQNDQNNAMYKNYKTLITTLTKEEIMSQYPFVTENVASQLTENGPVYNFIVLTTISNNQIANKYASAVVQKLNPYVSQIETANSMFKSENYVRIIFNLNMPTSSEASFKAINEISDYLYKNYDGLQLVCETYVYSQIKDVFNSDIVKVNLISFFAVLIIIAITFKGAFVPVLLTVLIQGAIWVTMGISTIFGNNIFFICYLVVMCIQMGATIDYGILLTNNYVNSRKIMNKRDAMNQALKSSATTIFTSGSILILATLIVGLVSKVSIISDLGLLLTRGCIISVVMIILCLPQCLLLCDKVIEKTTYKTKFFNE